MIVKLVLINILKWFFRWNILFITISQIINIYYILIAFINHGFFAYYNIYKWNSILSLLNFKKIYDKVQQKNKYWTWTREVIGSITAIKVSSSLMIPKSYGV